jgi:succinate dehydrogenase / fumarate reductase cytochrome b subunit
MRAIMATALGLHVWAAITLTQQNAAARPTAYQHGRTNQMSTIFSRTMRFSGVLLLLYIVGHVAHITLGLGVPDFQFGQPYETVVKAFQNPIVAALYVVANLGLFFHLFHATWSSLKTLGFDHPQYGGMLRGFSLGLAAVVSLVNISFPIMVVIGVVQ